MCLTVIDNHGNHEDIAISDCSHTATENITVYKIIRADNKSMFYEFQYIPNTLYQLNARLRPVMTISLSYGYQYYYIDNGFHSYKMTHGQPNVEEFYKAVEFIIPKGATYYFGMNGDIVSDQIRSGSLDALVL